MLADMLASLTTTIAPHLRALGYLEEAMALRRRFRRDREAWQPHLDRTQRFVLSAAERCSSRNRVIVLGSGLLLDVPLAELAETFREVVLMDVVCLPEARKRMKRFGNVRFEERDLTGVAERLYRSRQQGMSLLFAPGMPSGAADQADLVVSLNILSQLWVIPRSFLAGHFRALPSEQIEDWCLGIVHAHYSWLRSLSCDACLVADFEQVKRDNAGAVISRSTTVYDLALPAPDETWIWIIAPISGRNPHHSKELVVGGWYFAAA